MNIKPKMPANWWLLPSTCNADAAAVPVVIEETALAFGLPPDQLFSRAKHQPVAWARQIAMALLRDDYGLSSNSVARIFQRDHGTVLHAGAVVRDRRSVYPQLAQEIDRIRANVRARLERERAAA